MRQPGRVVRGGLVWVVRGTHYLGEVLSRFVGAEGTRAVRGAILLNLSLVAIVLRCRVLDFAVLVCLCRNSWRGRR
jgi:hypothetical protein